MAHDAVDPVPAARGTDQGPRAHDLSSSSSALEEARRLLEQITPGEWRWGSGEPDFYTRTLVATEHGHERLVLRMEDDSCEVGNTEFIAAAPRLVSALLGEVQRLQEVARQWSNPTPELQALRETAIELTQMRKRVTALEAAIGQIVQEMRSAADPSVTLQKVTFNQLVLWMDTLAALVPQRTTQQHDDGKEQE